MQECKGCLALDKSTVSMILVSPPSRYLLASGDVVCKCIFWGYRRSDKKVIKNKYDVPDGYGVEVWK